MREIRHREVKWLAHGPTARTRRNIWPQERCGWVSNCSAALLKMEVSGREEQLGGLTMCFYPAVCSCSSGRQRDRQLGSTEPWSEGCSKTEQESESYRGLFLHWLYWWTGKEGTQKEGRPCHVKIPGSPSINWKPWIPWPLKSLLALKFYNSFGAQ